MLLQNLLEHQILTICLKATFNAFKMSESPKSIASKRSKKINEITNNKE